MKKWDFHDVHAVTISDISYIYFLHITQQDESIDSKDLSLQKLLNGICKVLYSNYYTGFFKG